MKVFIPALIISYILLYAFLLFGGVFLLSQTWFCLLLPAAIIAAVITRTVNQDEKISALEKRIDDLETQQSGEEKQ